MKEPELRKVLAQDVLSLEDAQSTVNQALEQLTKADTYSRHCIEATLLRSRESLLRNKLRIQSEAPFNKWLYDYIFGTLDKSYVVEMQECNLKDVGLRFTESEINEYATSRADLVIKKDQVATGDQKCCVIFTIQQTDITAMVAELKVDDSTTFPLLECFRNMSAVAASITIDALKQGFIVNEVTVFGVVVQISSLDHSRLIKLYWNFETGQCNVLMNLTSVFYVN